MLEVSKVKTKNQRVCRRWAVFRGGTLQTDVDGCPLAYPTQSRAEGVRQRGERVARVEIREVPRRE